MEIEILSIIPDRQRAARKPRADAQRNRDLIVQVAKDAFTENGAGTSLDDIVKKAGIGAGTLYRHFPSREALLEAVYRAEVEKLAEAAEELGRTLPPLEALRAWFFLFIDHLATKKIIAAALNNLVGASQMFEKDKPRVLKAVSSIFALAAASGDIRPEIDPVDILRAVVGLTFFGTPEDWKKSAFSLVDILILGSRPLPCL